MEQNQPDQEKASIPCSKLSIFKGLNKPSKTTRQEKTVLVVVDATTSFLMEVWK